MEKHRLQIVDAVDPKSATVIKTGFFGPLAVGKSPRKGKSSYVCGKCGKTLLKGVREGVFSNFYIVCGRCGSHNKV